MRNVFATLSLVTILGTTAASAQATCPNQSATVTIPYPTGTADVTVYSSPDCTALLGTDLKVYNGTNVLGAVLSTTTKPAVVQDAAGLHFSANSASYGSAVPLYIVHVPSGKAVQMTANVGAPITAVVGGTSTP